MCSQAVALGTDIRNGFWVQFWLCKVEGVVGGDTQQGNYLMLNGMTNYSGT